MVDPSPESKALNKTASRRWSGLGFRRSRLTSKLSWQGLFRRRNLLVWAVISAAFLLLFFSPARGTAGSTINQESLSKAEALSRQIREISLGVTDPAVLDSAFRRAILPASAAPNSDPWRSSSGLQLLTSKISAVLLAFSQAKPVVPCTWDQTLPVGTPVIQGRVLLAANMHNNEDLLPHFTLQLLQLLIVLPRGSAFVSIYESDSKDNTGSWLEALRDLLVCLGVPHRIVINGNLTRGEGQDRIDFLAQARNRALEPLWLTAALATQLQHLREGHSRHLQSWGVHLPQGSTSASGALWDAEKVVFLNDVYFCAQDVVRLLHHDGDMVCGMDFDRPTLNSLSHQEQHSLFGQYMWRKWRIPGPVGRWVGKSGLANRHWRLSPATNAAYQDTQPMGFYDTWVARDSDGNMFLKLAPYVTDPYSLERVALGLPFPVKCCWNGLVVMNAKPFSQLGLRVRMHKRNECAASECSLVCNDLQRMGFRNIIVDPSVRQAYNVPDAKLLYTNTSVRELPFRQWSYVQHAAPIDWNLVPHRPYAKCCGLPQGHDMVEFDKDCHWENFMTPNFTAMS